VDDFEFTRLDLTWSTVIRKRWLVVGFHLVLFFLHAYRHLLVCVYRSILMSAVLAECSCIHCSVWHTNIYPLTSYRKKIELYCAEVVEPYFICLCIHFPLLSFSNTVTYTFRFILVLYCLYSRQYDRKRKQVDAGQ
jgi:hypothetical protein